MLSIHLRGHPWEMEKMKKYVASMPNAEIIGTALKPYDTALQRYQFEAVLETYGLTQIDPDVWYPQQLTLDIQKAIKALPDGSTALISVGMKIIEHAIFPPMESVSQAVQAFAASYPMNFRNHAPTDVVKAELVTDHHIRVINCSPHSDEMIYGYVYGMARRFCPPNFSFKVRFHDMAAVDQDGDTVIDLLLDEK
ncbi:MAG: hypothetical protein SF162_07500 [bacterium]|nr:hypothetical protein [bacterium]